VLYGACKELGDDSIERALGTKATSTAELEFISSMRQLSVTQQW
jgi:hypothetical protein